MGHHICVWWESSSGSWKLYKDGDLKQEGTNFKRGHTIRQGGTLVLGQEQDSVGGGFQTSQSFQGMLSNVNVWDHVLDGMLIKKRSKSCELKEGNEGNVFKWQDFLHEGGTRLVHPSPCKIVEHGTWQRYCDLATDSITYFFQFFLYQRWGVNPLADYKWRERTIKMQITN